MDTLPENAFLLAVQNTPLPSYWTLKIIPGAPKTAIKGVMDDGTWKIAVSAPPEKGKANTALQKFLGHLTQQKVSILSGETDRKKLIRIG